MAYKKIIFYGYKLSLGIHKKEPQKHCPITNGDQLFRIIVAVPNIPHISAGADSKASAPDFFAPRDAYAVYNYAVSC